MTEPNEFETTAARPSAPPAAGRREIGAAIRNSLLLLAILAAAVGVFIYWHNHRLAGEPTPAAPPGTTTVEPPQATFTDITEPAGVKFVHENGAAGDKLLPETMGAGCAWIDYNNSRRPSLLLINGMKWPGKQTAGQPSAAMALYRNNGDGTFTDVTKESGLDVPFYGMGVACGDYDNDGWVDLFVTAVGKNHLFHNDHGKFREVTDAAHVGGPAGAGAPPTQWSTSAAFVDYDNDGHLDLFVCNYVKWSRELDLAQTFSLAGGGRTYGPPLGFEGTYCYLYHNNGDGTFTDVSAEAGIQVKNSAGAPAGKSLGVIPVDLDGDGLIDFVVANDTTPNFVFHNLGHGKFEEIGAASGIAFDASGNARGAMGIDAGWFRNDGRTLGIAIGNFANEMSSLYVSQQAPLVFSDDAIAAGIGQPSRQWLKFGTVFFDYDLDGRPDLLSVNGHLDEAVTKIGSGQKYRQPPQLFWNAGHRTKPEFIAVPPDKTGADFAKPLIGRGLAFADIDGDGDLDLVMTSVGEHPRLLRNDQHTGHHWLRLKLVGKKCNRDAIGAIVDVQLGDQILRQQVMPTRGYLSQSELPLTFGLGDRNSIDKIKIHWPGGDTQTVPNVEIDRAMTITEAH